WKTDAISGPTDAADHSTNPTWQPQSILKDMQTRIRSMDKRMAAQTAAITALAGQVGSGADTATVVAAVEAAIERAVIDVNINTREG
ncbi:N-acetylmuramoyl-L-alanine amidase, partial [Streptomyces sp. NPDC088270]